MSAKYPRAVGALVAASLLTALLGPAMAQDVDCDARLLVEFDPEVPNANNDEFLSSLLNRHLDYRLELLGQNDQDPSVLEVELTGPGPEYRCQSVVQTMRRDARVQSIRIESIQVAWRS